MLAYKILLCLKVQRIALNTLLVPVTIQVIPNKNFKLQVTLLQLVTEVMCVLKIGKDLKL